MKNILLVLLLFSTSAAFGQYIGNHVDSQVQVYHIPDHPAHASYSQIGDGSGIVGGGGMFFARGDRPASDFPQATAVPLGDSARELKKQHAQVKKARVIWEN
ncbi:MAG: hypothetical protein ABSG70_12430 [Terriglobales bacterium]|jgi:hypothetical protein